VPQVECLFSRGRGFPAAAEMKLQAKRFRSESQAKRRQPKGAFVAHRGPVGRNVLLPDSGAMAGIFGILSTANELTSPTEGSVTGRTDLWFYCPIGTERRTEYGPALLCEESLPFSW
jgi:hypothetical protein